MENLQRRIVQFHHMGKEHLISEDGASFSKKDEKKILAKGIMPWNDGAHRRKFMKNDGKYIGLDNKIVEGEIMLWGEWEGISNISKIDYKKSPIEEDMPKYIHKPRAVPLEKCIDNPVIPQKDGIDSWQNTDPYIYGNFFIYSNCQQSKGKNGIMKSLDRGSVIAMGSHVGVFCVDTVFVVSEVLCTYSRSNLKGIKKLLRDGVISHTFWNATIVPLLELYEKEQNSGSGCGMKKNENIEEREFKLYKAATYDNQVDGMYSFFPCKPYADGQGFKRIPLNHDKYINPHLTQKIQSRDKDSSPWIVERDEAYDFWNSIRLQVLQNEQDLRLGIWTKEPELE